LKGLRAFGGSALGDLGESGLNLIILERMGSITAIGRRYVVLPSWDGGSHVTKDGMAHVTKDGMDSHVTKDGMAHVTKDGMDSHVIQGRDGFPRHHTTGWIHVPKDGMDSKAGG
jgi:hypothetical protein